MFPKVVCLYKFIVDGGAGSFLTGGLLYVILYLGFSGGG